MAESEARMIRCPWASAKSVSPTTTGWFIWRNPRSGDFNSTKIQKSTLSCSRSNLKSMMIFCANAQLWFDLKFDGAAILYSWPSKGSLSEYMADETSVEWTAPHLKKFLEEIA